MQFDLRNAPEESHRMKHYFPSVNLQYIKIQKSGQSQCDLQFYQIRISAENFLRQVLQFVV